jgi:hypothetical protein
MSHAHYFYFSQNITEVEKIFKIHQEDFEELLGDTFTEEELLRFEPLLDSLGAIFVQPIISELSFDDFYVNELQAEKQQKFFESCKSSICLENLADFSLNPFQVTYLNELLRSFDEVLIDRGGVSELLFKKDYIEMLKNYKNIFALLSPVLDRPVIVNSSRPIDPIDFLIKDVLIELERLEKAHLLSRVIEESNDWSLKTQKAFFALREGSHNAGELLAKSGLGAKDFDDHLEKLKFLLKKIKE